MAIEKCKICGKEFHPGDPGHFVKVKGQRGILWYCEKCAKGGGKHGDTAGKRH